MKKPSLSVVIPAYNAEKTITRAIDSIVNQTYEGAIEIVVVNDGSKDETKAKLEQYEVNSVYLRTLKAHHQPNGGVSRARNRGIELATGDYLIFLDADDTYLKDAFLIFMDRVCEIDCDFLISPVELTAEEAVITSETAKSDFYELFLTGILNSPCGKVFKTQALKESSVFFDPAFSMGEDLLFNVAVYFNAHKIVVLPYDGYEYDREMSTLTGRFKDDYFEERLSVLAAFKSILTEQGVVFEDEAWFHVKLCYSVFLKYVTSAPKKSLTQRVAFIKKVRRHAQIRTQLAAFSGAGLVRKLSGIVLKWSPSWFIALGISLLPMVRKLVPSRSKGVSV